MKIEFVKFRGYRCFKKDWVGFDEIKPINVIIGRNNAGKSHLLDLVEALCLEKLEPKQWQYLCQGILDEPSLKREFDPSVSGGYLGGNHWHSHGVHFKDKWITWEFGGDSSISNIRVSDKREVNPPYGEQQSEEREKSLSRILRSANHLRVASKFRRLYADRDIRSEVAETSMRLGPDGSGATNIVRRYIVSSSEGLSRHLIQRELLQALNEIFADDGGFTEIQVQLHDEGGTECQEGHWEIYLGQDKKGLISLSRSGSGLKTVFLVLLNLLVIPKIENASKSNFSFAFEELENNLHPALLRRLLQYLENYAIKEEATLFLTTHSSVALDIFGLSENAQIIHVRHDGESANAGAVEAHFERLGVISELGAKPSDLLQANGIIWVEGPSDCIYLNRWIDLFSGGELKEGRDYQCAFYGGSLLARTQFTSPEKAEEELVNLFRINSNIIVICDGDRSGPSSRIKDRVRRIHAEVRSIPGAHIWVTKAREIENYIPGSILAEVYSRASLPDPGQYESFFVKKGGPARSSYVEKRINIKSVDKMELAVLSVQHMKKETMEIRFELKLEIESIVEKIRGWAR